MKRLFGLIGTHLGHSYSAKWFNEKFGIENIDAEYRLFPIPEISELPELIRSNPGLTGLNVTIPYKEKILSYINQIDNVAAEIGAVNVVRIKRNFKDDPDNYFLKGYNSDVYGFGESIKPLLAGNERLALVLGTGGASKCVEFYLKQLGIKVIKVSRNPSFDSNIITYQEVTPELVGKTDIIVNATPTGMYPAIERFPKIPYYAINGETICYDLIYNPSLTMFLEKCKESGARIKNGLEMLRLQAQKAWEIWNDE